MAPSTSTAMAAMMVAAAAALVLMGGAAEGAVYTVGDAGKWTTINMPNYTQWSASKKFHAGDTILFVYNKQFHNALQVSKADYDACKADSPIKVLATGNDSFTLGAAGHYYFLCGFPGHCLAGQKVDVLVSKASSTPSTSPSEAPAPSAISPSLSPSGGASGSTTAPSPATNGASPSGSASGSTTAPSPATNGASGGVSMGWLVAFAGGISALLAAGGL